MAMARSTPAQEATPQCAGDAPQATAAPTGCGLPVARGLHLKTEMGPA